jgi:hypothetical protein
MDKLFTEDNKIWLVTYYLKSLQIEGYLTKEECSQLIKDAKVTWLEELRRCYGV